MSYNYILNGITSKEDVNKIVENCNDLVCIGEFKGEVAFTTTSPFTCAEIYNNPCSLFRCLCRSGSKIGIFITDFDKYQDPVFHGNLILVEENKVDDKIVGFESVESWNDIPRFKKYNLQKEDCCTFVINFSEKERFITKKILKNLNNLSIDYSEEGAFYCKVPLCNINDTVDIMEHLEKRGVIEGYSPILKFIFKPCKGKEALCKAILNAACLSIDISIDSNGAIELENPDRYVMEIIKDLHDKMEEGGLIE